MRHFKVKFGEDNNKYSAEHDACPAFSHLKLVSLSVVNPEAELEIFIPLCIST